LCVRPFGVCGVLGVLDVLPDIFLGGFDGVEKSSHLIEGVHSSIEPDANADAVLDWLAWLECPLDRTLDCTLFWLF
jgi:hypothetical protein